MKRTLIAGLITLLLSTALQVPAFASSPQVSVEVADSNAESFMTADDAVGAAGDEETEAKTETAAKKSVDDVIREIDAITEESEIASIATVYGDYNALNFSERTRVTNYDKLRAVAEAKDFLSVVEIPDVNGNTNPEDMETVKKGTIYTTYIDDNEAVSISIGYESDEDGNVIQPILTLISPTGARTTISNQISKLSGADQEMTLHWNPGFCQIDIASAEKGKWSIQSTSTVTFTLMDYAGEYAGVLEAEENLPVISTASELSETTHEKIKGGHTSISSPTMSMLLLFGTIAAIFAAFMVYAMMRKKIREEIKNAQKDAAQAKALPKPKTIEEKRKVREKKGVPVKSQKEKEMDALEEINQGMGETTLSDLIQNKSPEQITTVTEQDLAADTDIQTVVFDEEEDESEADLK